MGKGMERKKGMEREKRMEKEKEEEKEKGKGKGRIVVMEEHCCGGEFLW